MPHIKGTFDVKVIPQGAGDVAHGIALGRMSIDKQFHGELEGTSKGEMLTAMTESTGSAAYVAVERVTGTIKGLSGSFALLHRGLASRDSQLLTVTVAPGSGTGEFAGIEGTLVINIVDKKHFYEFDYSLP